jgi:hypothetical protein
MGIARPTLKNEEMDSKVYTFTFYCVHDSINCPVGIQCAKVLFFKHIKHLEMLVEIRGAKLPARSWFGIHWLCGQKICGSLLHPIQKPFRLFLGSQYCKPLYTNINIG